MMRRESSQSGDSDASDDQPGAADTGLTSRVLTERASGVTSRRNVLKTVGAIAAAGATSIVLTDTATAQNGPAERWTNAYYPDNGNYGSYGYSHAPGHDGGHMYCGYRYNPGSGRADYALYKTDQYGDLEWEKYPSYRYYDHAYDIVPYDGGYTACGYSHRRNNPEYSNYSMMKYNEDGDIILQEDYSSGDRTDDRAYGLYYDDNNRYVMGGYADESRGQGGKDFWLVYADDDLQKVADYKYDYRDDECWKVKKGHGNGHVMVGYSSGGDQYGNYNGRCTYVDYDGNERWSREYDYRGYPTWCYDVVPYDDKYGVCGYTYHPNHRRYVYIIFICGSQGRVIDRYTYYLPGYNSYCYAADTTDEGIMLHGYAARTQYNSDYLTLYLPKDGGQPYWFHRNPYGDYDVGWDVYTYPDDNYYTTCGYSRTSRGYGTVTYAYDY